jgi:hypothetical protein
VGANDSFEDVGDGDFGRKQASLYTFPSLERHPLRSFTGLFHFVLIDHDEDDNAATTGGETYAQAATALTKKVISSLPEKLVELRLSLCEGEDSALISRGFAFDIGLASLMVQRHGSTLQELEIKSIRFDMLETLHNICVGFKELRSLKLFGVHEFGLTTAEILRQISTSSDRAAVAGCPNLEVLQICLADSVAKISSGRGATDSGDDDDLANDVSFRSPYLKRLWLEGCDDIVKLDLLETPSIERLSIIQCCSLTHLGIVVREGDNGFSSVSLVLIMYFFP